MWREEAGSHSQSHLVYFQRSMFPSSFPCLDLAARGSERDQAALRAFSLSLAAASFSGSFTSFCSPTPLLLSVASCSRALPASWASHAHPVKCLSTPGHLSLTSSLHPWACGKALHGAWFCLVMAADAKSLQSGISARASTATACYGFGKRAKAVWGTRYSMVWYSVAQHSSCSLSASTHRKPCTGSSPKPPHTTSAPLCFPFPPSLLSWPC